MPWSARRRPRSSSPWPTACLAASNWAAPWRCWARCIPRPWWPPRIALRSRPSRRICSNLAGLFGEQVGGDVFSRDVPDFWSWLEMFLIFGHGFPMCSHVFPIRKSSDRCFFCQKCFYCCSILPRGIDAGGHPGNFDPRKRGTITKNERILQELSAKIRHASTCGSREFVTSSYHDILHRNWIYVWE